MDSSYRPQSPDLPSYAPRSPDLSGFQQGQQQSPDLAGTAPAPRHGHGHGHQHSNSRDRFGPAGGSAFQPGDHFAFGSPTSVLVQPQYGQQYDQHQQYGMPTTRRNHYPAPDDAFLPDVPPPARPSLPSLQANGFTSDGPPSQLTGAIQGMSTQPVDPTLGVQLKTSFPVARIKRIMQADDDIGKVAQVTPHVVSRALELFMIKLISASADQARGNAPGGSGKGPKRILSQHMKKALASDESYDFLADIIAKVPDAPTKGKKDGGSDSEEGPSGVGRPKKKAKKRKDSGDDF